MKIADHENPAYLNLVWYICSHHYLSDEQFDEFKLYDDLLYDFNRLKRDCHERALRCGCEIIPVGHNCLPHTLCVRWGLIPTLNQNPDRGRLPFDLCWHNPHYILDILSTSFQNYCADKIAPLLHEPNGTSYLKNSQYKIVFNHDPVDSKISDSENITLFNKKLKERIVNFNKICKSENKIFVIFYENYLPENINQLDNFVRRNYNSILLKIYNKTDLASSYDKMLLAPWPEKDYIWYVNKFWFTSGGFDFEYRIINFILKHLESLKIKQGRPLQFCLPAYDQYKLYLLVANYYCDIGLHREAGKFLSKALNFTEGYKPALWHWISKRIINGS